MAFDQSTRNRLSRFVTDARTLLTEECTRQLQRTYGIDPASGELTDVERLSGISDAERQTAGLLRETAEHYQPGFAQLAPRARRETIERIVREQAFTVLNRLCALRMAEARGLLIESIAAGYQSRGFQLYARLAGSALGETGDAYRCYLFSLFDEFAVDLAVLFDRFSPAGRLFRVKRRCSGCSTWSTTPRSSRCGPRTRRSAGSTSTSTARKSARPCATPRPRRATAASWPCATSSSRRATWSSS